MAQYHGGGQPIDDESCFFGRHTLLTQTLYQHFHNAEGGRKRLFQCVFFRALDIKHRRRIAAEVLLVRFKLHAGRPESGVKMRSDMGIHFIQQGRFRGFPGVMLMAGFSGQLTVRLLMVLGQRPAGERHGQRNSQGQGPGREGHAALEQGAQAGKKHVEKFLEFIRPENSPCLPVIPRLADKFIQFDSAECSALHIGLQNCPHVRTGQSDVPSFHGPAHDQLLEELPGRKLLGRLAGSNA